MRRDAMKYKSFIYFFWLTANHFFSSLMRVLGRHLGEISSSGWGQETDADVLHRGYVEWYNKPINTIISPKVNSNVCDNLMKWWNKLYNMSIKPMHWLMYILYKFFFTISSNYDKDRGMRNRGMIRFQKKTSSGKGTRFQRKFLGLGLRSFD